MRLIALEYHDVVALDAWDSSGFPGVAARPYKIAAADFEQHLSAIDERVSAAGEATAAEEGAMEAGEVVNG